ncbi:MAG: aminopeptidase P family protein [Anaerolineales bacterium]|nr:aminopeptidase P family protein [Anaerolineales bacterium]
MNPALIREKLDQAAAILAEQDLDLWLTFVRETSLTRDPALDLVAGLDMTWHSAFLISRTGERVAIVGRFDADNVQALGAYTQVIPYDQSLRPALRAAVERLAPRTIAINYSESDPAADGLTHGLWLTLQAALAGTPYAERLVPAEAFLAALRGRKSAAEIDLIRQAVRATERLFARLTNTLKPGQTERQIAGWLTAERERLGLGPAWDAPYCPVVNAGPESPVGHTRPGAYKAARGQLLHIDFGVQRAGFCSDLQRTWYFLDKGERRAPDDVRLAWEACWAAVDAGAAALRPGALGWEVDAAARAALVAAGFPEYQHALGHQLGRVAHDGATLLGPRWDRYGQAPRGRIEVDQVYTLELGVYVTRRGYLGLEEDVRVTPDGLEWLSKPQRKLWLV